MNWRTVAEGTSLDTLHNLVGDEEFGKGVPIRFELSLNQPVARLFDLAGAEWLFKNKMPEGLDLIDVHSEGDSKVIIEAESDPVWLFAIVGFVKVHWLAISLIAIGITLALALLVTAVKVKAPEKALAETKWIFIAIAVIAVVLLAGFLVLRKGGT